MEGVGGVREGKGCLNLSLYIVFLCTHAALFSPPTMELNLPGGGNKMLWSSKTQNSCSDLESVLSSLMHCPWKVTMLLWDDGFKGKLKSIS